MRSEPRPREVIILQTVSPDYRQPVWRALVKRNGGSVLIIAGFRYFAPSVVTRHDEGSPLATVQNRYLLGRRVLIQRLPLDLALGARSVIAELNPRILSTWLVLCLRRILRRRTVLWGHAFSRSGVSTAEDWVRQVMRHLANTIAVYTEAEHEALARRMPGKDIVIAPNALLSRDEMAPRAGGDEVRDFIYVGRLVEEKRLDLLIRAYLSASAKLSAGSRLLVVGDGPLRETLERQVAEAGASERVWFAGHVSRVEELRALYSTALASVSPGYVGLSITQSLGFGVPMIVADHESHSPEIEAADPELNCLFFRAGSADALADALVAVDRDALRWIERAARISQACRERYSVETLAERLLGACEVRSDRACSTVSQDALVG
jgi:glycosyltransferase involved in cell wall biosynthesis